MEQRLSISSDTKNLSKLEAFLASTVEKQSMDEPCYHNAVVVLTEAVNNAINHGNKRDSAKSVEITVAVENERLKITVKDEGEGFDIDSIPDPLHPDNLLREGGRGIFLIKAFAESVDFQDTGNGTLTSIRMKMRNEPNKA